MYLCSRKSPPAPFYADKKKRKLITIANKFLVKDVNFNCQYASLYFCRLQQLRNLVNTNRPVLSIKDVTTNGECVVVGTVSKMMKLKYTALQEYLKTIQVDEERINFVDVSDTVFLEDETGRLKLLGVDHSTLLTGLIIGCLGELVRGGCFLVKEVIWPSVPRALPVPISDASPLIGVVAGLRVGHLEPEFRLDMLIDLFSSHPVASQVDLLVVAGNTFEETDTVEDSSAVDAWLATLGCITCVHIMPGSKDPVPKAMPQQPFPRSFFPKCVNYGSVCRVTNPHLVTVGERRYLVVGEELVKSVSAYSGIEGPLDVLDLALRARCCAPTAPDILACYPFAMADPFAMAEEADLPDVLIASCGGSSDGQVQYREAPSGHLLVAVPDFHSTGRLAMIRGGQTVFQISVRQTDAL